MIAVLRIRVGDLTDLVGSDDVTILVVREQPEDLTELDIGNVDIFAASGADEEDAEILRLAGAKRGEAEVAHRALRTDEAGHLAVGVSRSGLVVI